MSDLTCFLFSPVNLNQRTASSLSHDEENGDPGAQNSKKQRLHLDESTLQDNKDENHSTVANKEILRSSTMAKLSCFVKNSNSMNLSNKNEVTRVEVTGEHIRPKVMEKDVNSESKTECISIDDDDRTVEEMDSKNSDIASSKDFNVTQFACISCPPSKHISTIKDITAPKSDVRGSRCLNPKTKSTYTPLELQFLEVKSKYPNVILLVECGYRYRFFAEDAEVCETVKQINNFYYLRVTD